MRTVLTHFPICPNGGCVGGLEGLYVISGSLGLSTLCAVAVLAKEIAKAMMAMARLIYFMVVALYFGYELFVTMVSCFTIIIFDQNRIRPIDAVTSDKVGSSQKDF